MSAPAPLREDEALVVEKAVRLAIDSIINVLYGVSSARTHEYQRMVADRDKEIQRLERRLGDIEQELRAVRRHGCGCGLLSAELGQTAGQGPAEPQRAEPGGLEPNGGLTAPQECEMSFSLGLFARPPSQFSAQSHESALPSSPARLGLDQNSSEASAVLEAMRNLPSSPTSLMVKEEPCDVDAVLIKWEMNEERLVERQENPAGQCPDLENHSGKKRLEIRETNVLEKTHQEPNGLCVMDGERQRSRKRGVPVSEEEAQRLKRAAWRAASRRYYARKVARQQGNPARLGPGVHLTNSQYLQPSVSYMMDKRKGPLLPDFPDEAWAPPPRRFCGQKSPPGQGEPPHCFIQNTAEPPREAQGPKNGRPQTGGGGLGGILCS